MGKVSELYALLEDLKRNGEAVVTAEPVLFSEMPLNQGFMGRKK